MPTASARETAARTRTPVVPSPARRLNPPEQGVESTIDPPVVVPPGEVTGPRTHLPASPASAHACQARRGCDCGSARARCAPSDRPSCDGARRGATPRHTIPGCLEPGASGAAGPRHNLTGPSSRAPLRVPPAAEPSGVRRRQPVAPSQLSDTSPRSATAAGGPSLLAISGVIGARPPANSSKNGLFTNSGAPRMYAA